ncbi:MAG: hypothetical protein FWE83_06550 [Oscillospiraceae bacterium]|nr:hypothetical protein [Oscillospiraceae bacterium]
MNDIESLGLKIGRRTFISTAAMLLGVMIFAFILTQIIPAGVFEREIVGGREIVLAGSYMQTDDTSLPFWRVLTAPFEVFAGPDAAVAIMVIFSIMLIGGAFLILDKCGLIKYSMQLVIRRFEKKKYVLLAAVTFFCMLLGAGMGIFEETVILAPIAVALAVSLRWDALVGAGMSLIAVGFGFAAGIFNPFSTGVAQRLAGLPLFSGLWLRIIMFVVIYSILLAFLLLYARRIEKNPEKSLLYGLKNSSARFSPEEAATSGVNEQSSGDPGDDAETGAVAVTGMDTATGAVIGADKAIGAVIGTDKTTGADTVTEDMEIHARKCKRGLIFFGVCLLAIAVYVTAGAFIPELTDFSMPVIALVIMVGGIGAGLLTGHNRVFRDFGKGIVTFLPSVVLLMLALSVKHIFVSGGIMDTLLQYAYNFVIDSSALTSLIIVFLFVLCLEFFIGGASAKAFLIIPLLAPLAEMVGLTRQSIVLAFTLGDGFANVLYPTNAVLLIVLGIIGVPYLTWLKWTWKLQLLFVLVSIGFLTLAHAVGYGPF